MAVGRGGSETRGKKSNQARFEDCTDSRSGYSLFEQWGDRLGPLFGIVTFSRELSGIGLDWHFSVGGEFFFFFFWVGNTILRHLANRGRCRWHQKKQLLEL